VTNRNQLIASAAATLGVLEVLGGARDGLPLKAVVERTGRPKGTVHRMLSTLVNTGFVAQDSVSGIYRVTLKLWRIAATAVRDLDLVKTARPWLERLASDTGETPHLALLDPSGGVVYISKVESSQSIRVQTHIGQIGPSWCTATGRILLAFDPVATDKVLAARLEARTSKTVTDPKRIRGFLRDIAAKGYSVTKSENHPEMGGIAAPIRDHAGNVVASCGVAIPAFRMDRELVDRCVPQVLKAAAGISADLGYHATAEGKVKRAA
jgi:IclR family transcriptional regulator, KDG regulon repressor